MIIEVSELGKRFPVRRSWAEILRRPAGGAQAQVLQDVSFSVRAGEIFGLLGPNGAGKTTLFKLLATLLEPDQGSARVDGLDLHTDAAQIRRRLAPVLANERSLYWRLSALENLRLFAALQAVPAREADAECQRVLAVTGLSDTGNKMVGAFSSGMRQRLLIARALIGAPRILLLDEPTRSLDPISARDFRRFLRETVVRSEGCTVLLATHDAEEVWDLCDRVAVLHRGRLLAVDHTAALRHRAAAGQYQLWVRDAQVDATVAVLHGAAASPVRGQQPAPEPGWTVLHCELPGGADAAAALVAALAAQGLPPARVEFTAPSLATMIERVLADA